MSYNKVYFVRIQERSLTNPRVLRVQMPRECFNDYRKAVKALEDEVELYGNHFGWDMRRDEQIVDLYSGYENGKKMVELSVNGLIIH